MPIALREATEFFSDAIDKIMLVAGFFCLVIALAFFSRAYQWFSLGIFISGVILILIGALVHYESPTLKFPSMDGWGTILMCLSAVVMASTVIAFLFAVPGSVAIIPTSFRRGSTEKIMAINLERPMQWLAPILAWISIGLFVFGFALKFIRDIF